MTFAPKLKWIKDKFSKMGINKVILFIISLSISYFLYEKLGEKNLLITILIFAGIYLFFVSLIDLIKLKNNLSQNIAHFGFSLLILSILFNAFFSKEFSSNMKIGDQIRFENELIKFNKVETNKGINFNSLIASFVIENENKKITKFFPEIRIYNQPNILTSEADIRTSIFYDRFFVINLIKNENYFNVRYQIKSFMIWIWISALIIAFGGFVGLIKKIK
jgi:cytochrome c-type biogenesis protein CcmF